MKRPPLLLAMIAMLAASHELSRLTVDPHSGPLTSPVRMGISRNHFIQEIPFDAWVHI
jgi:hypothetical protein